MSRTVEEVLASGYVTAEEEKAIDFALDLEDNEASMGEGAALALTCEMNGYDIDDYAEIMMELPDGDWWLAKDLFQKDDVS